MAEHEKEAVVEVWLGKENRPVKCPFVRILTIRVIDSEGRGGDTIRRRRECLKCRRRFTTYERIDDPTR
jgi:transcriptional repressor NrdR